MANKDKIHIDKKEDKVSRIVTGIATLGIGEETRPTPFAEAIGMHSDTLRVKLDEYQTFMEAGKIEIKRNSKGRIVRIKKVEDDSKDLKELNFKREIRDTLKQIQEEIENLKKIK